MKQAKLTISLMAGVMATVFGITPGVFAGDLEIQQVQSVPDINTDQAGKGLFDFDSGGTIFRIGHDERGKKIIVVDDRLRYFSPGVAFYDEQGSRIAENQFKQGSQVGYFLNENRQITKLYLLESQ